ARWVAAAAARDALPSPGARLAATRCPTGLRGPVAAAGRGGAGTGSGAGAAGRDGPGSARCRTRLEAGDDRPVQQGRAVRRHRAAAGRDPGAGSAAAGPPAADPGPERGPRAPAHGGVVRHRAGLAGSSGHVPVAAARAGAGNGPPAADLHRRRRVGRARGPDGVACLGGRAGAVPGAGREPVGAAGVAARTGVRFADRRPFVQSGAAGHLHQARRAHRTAPAGHRGPVATGARRGTGAGLPRTVLRLLPPAGAGSRRSSGLPTRRRARRPGHPGDGAGRAHGGL
ncbi:MAG: hypothetical protein AVDCRST_MAG57-2987, partial [uncultured Blastococcus sp.]